MFKRLKRFGGADRWNLLVPFIGAGLSVVVYYLTGGGWAFYASLILSVLTYLTSEKLSRLTFEGDMRKFFDRAQQGEQDLIFLGSINKAIDWLRDNSSGLDMVQNTVFTASRLNRKYRVDERHQKDLDAVIKDALSEGCVWVDICSPEQREAVDAFVGTVDAAKRKHYHSYELAANVPIIQCMVLQYRDGRQAVLYGWSFASQHNKRDAVYLGQGKDTVDFFKGYLDALEEQAKQVHGATAVVGPKQAGNAPRVVM